MNIGMEDKLREVLRLALADADANDKTKSFKDQYKTIMHNMYNITAGEATDILTGKLPVELMQKDTLFKVTSVLHELNKTTKGTFDSSKLNVDDYFTDKEKLEYSQKIIRKVQDEDIIIKAGCWTKVADDQIFITITPDDLMNYYINRNKINYNPKTQRNLTIKETKTGKIKTITFDKVAYGSISIGMANNDYISDILALNVNPDFYNPPRIVNGNVVIPNESQIDCIDGYHRLQGAITTKINNPDWNQPLAFFLFICDEAKAVKYILQQDKKIHLSDEQATKADDTDAANFIIGKLNDSPKFILRNTIDDTKFVILNKIITRLFNPSKLYKPEDRQEAVKLYQTIENNINELIEVNDLYNLEFTKEKWFIFLYILKHCVDNELDFVTIVNKLSIDDILNQIRFTNKPNDSHYRIMREVVKNV